MAIGTTLALVGAGIAAAGSVAGAAIGANAAGSAADKQAAAADQIKQQALQAADQAKTTVKAATDTANAGITDSSGKLDYAKAQQLAALKPYIDAGQVSLADVQKLLSDSGPLAGTANQFSFTPKDWQNDPGYDYIRQQALKGFDAQAASQGTAVGGGAIRGEARLTEDIASTHLDSAFNRALQTYQTNRTNVLQRLQGLTGLTQLGFNATGMQNQDIGNTAQLVNQNELIKSGNILGEGKYEGDVGLQAAQIAANATASKAQAQAAGDIGSANAINAGISGVGNAAQSVLYSLPGSYSDGSALGKNPYPINIPGTDTSNPLYTGYTQKP